MNKEKCFQTTNEILLRIVLEEYKEELVLSAERLLMCKEENDMETFDLELPFYTKMKFKIKQLEQLIDSEMSAYTSHVKIVSIQTTGFETIQCYEGLSIGGRF